MTVAGRTIEIPQSLLKKERKDLMKKQVYSGRYTVENEEEIVVFLIGMRINQRLAVHKWLPSFQPCRK